MRKTCLLLVWYLFAAIGMNAQQKMFEGEIVMEKFLQVPKFVSEEYNESGFHRLRYIIRGDNMLIIDETTGERWIWNNQTNENISFIPAIRLAVDWSLISSQEDNYIPTVKNTVSKKSASKEIFGQQCNLYEGKVVKKSVHKSEDYQLEMIFTTEIKAYISENLKSTLGNSIFKDYDIEIDGLPLQFTIKTTTASKSFSNDKTLQKALSKTNSENSTYMEYDVIEINPRTVSDEEFKIPTGYDVITSMHDSQFNQYLKERGKQRGGDASQKKTGVRYKTEGEWDF